MLRVLIVQRARCCVFVDLEEISDRVPRQELWYCMMKSEW